MALRVGTPMPLLEGATEWLNSEVKTDDLKGHLTLVYFWAVSCPYCLMNMPILENWREAYSRRGVRLVAVHMPRGEDDTDIQTVKRAVENHCITEPCAIDNDHTIGNRFETGGSWPHYFLFDTEGKTRSRSAGEFGLKMAESSLKRLLDEQQEAMIS